MEERIITTPDVLFGKPRIKGTRIPVDQILSYLSDGYTVEQILKEFPDLTQEDIRACIAYANRLVLDVRVTSLKSSDAEVSH